MRAHSGHRAGVLIARAFRIFRTAGPCYDSALNARAFRISMTLFRVLNVLNARAFRKKSGRGLSVLNILSARAFRTPSLRLECECIQDIQDAFGMS